MHRSCGVQSKEQADLGSSLRASSGRMFPDVRLLAGREWGVPWGWNLWYAWDGDRPWKAESWQAARALKWGNSPSFSQGPMFLGRHTRLAALKKLWSNYKPEENSTSCQWARRITVYLLSFLFSVIFSGFISKNPESLGLEYFLFFRWKWRAYEDSAERLWVSWGPVSGLY